MATVVKLRTHEFDPVHVRGWDGVKKAQFQVSLLDLVVHGREITETFCQVNPRRPLIGSNGRLRRTKVIKEMEDGLEDDPASFILRNQGITILAEAVELRQEKGDRRYAVLTLDDPELHGIINGLHTFMFALEREDAYRAALAQACVWVNVWTGLPTDVVAEMARGHNRSIQVKETDIDNLAGKFDVIREALAAARVPWADKVAYYTGEQDEVDGDKPITVGLLLQLMELFNTKRFDSQRHPVAIYSKLSATEQYYVQDWGDGDTIDPEPIPQLAAQLPVLAKLYEEVIRGVAQFPNYRRLGQQTREGSREANSERTVLPFSGGSVDAKVWKGWVFPILTSLRCALTISGGKATWRVDPHALLADVIGSLCQKCYTEHTENRVAPDKMGKRQTIYEDLYIRVQPKVEAMARTR